MKQPTESNDASEKGERVASPTWTVTLVPASSSARRVAASGSSSSATSRFTRCRSQRVAAPGPGPISSISFPRSSPAVTGSSTSDSMNSAHSAVLQRAWFSFMRPTLARSACFRKGVRCQVVSIDGQPASAAIVGTFPMPVGTRFEWHTHADHQLAWSPEGVLVVLIEGGGSYVLPPSRALWIPAGTVHETRASGAAVLRSVYLEPRRCPIDWTAPTPVAVSPLLGELIHHLDDRALGAEERSRAEAVLFDLLLPLRIATIDVRPPTDPRARDVSDALLADPADPRTLHEWGRAVGASSRTLARAFLSDTGLSFGRWRTLVRLQASLPYLAEQMPVSAVAPTRRVPDDERIRRRVPRPHRSHAGPLLPAAGAHDVRSSPRARAG